MNAHQMRRQRQDATSPELPADPVDDDGMTSASLRRLRAMMNDGKRPLYERLNAAEIVLVYELGPGAAVGSDPEEIGASSFRFMRAVADDPATPPALAMRALRSVASIENARAATRTTASELYAKKALLIGAANSERRRALIDHGAWPPAGGDRWWLDTADTVSWPPGWPGLWQWPMEAISDNYAHAAAASFRSMLRSIKATNRQDDFWEQFA